MRILPQGEEFSMLQPCLHCCIEELPRVVEFEKDGQNPRGGGRWKAARSTELENLKRISGNLHGNLFNSVVITSHIQATPTGSQPSGVCEGTEPYEFLRVETRSGATQTDHYAACAQSNPPPSRQSEFRSSIRSTIEPGEVVITEKKTATMADIEYVRASAPDSSFSSPPMPLLSSTYTESRDRSRPQTQMNSPANDGDNRMPRRPLS